MYAAEHAARHPDKPAIVMEPSGEVVTFSQLEARANQIAHLLRQEGLSRGDHIAVLSTNSPQMLEVEAGAVRCGIYYTLVDSHLGADELAYIVHHCRARVLFSSAALRGVASAAAVDCPRVEHLVEIGTPSSEDAPPPAPWQRLDELLRKTPAAPIADEQLGAPLLYSSGTTGRPKGIVRRLPEAAPGHSTRGMRFIERLYQFREGMTYLNPAPLYHSAPHAAVSAAYRLGATVVVLDHFDPELWLDVVSRRRVTHCQMVPTMFHRLLAVPEQVRARYDLSSLEVVTHAAAPCPVALKRAMIDWLGPIVSEYYGATESNGFTFCTAAEWLERPGTVGRAVLGEAVVRDDDGEECLAGVDGTIWWRGASNFEYLDDPAATAEHKSNGGDLSTVGDIGHVDAEGWVYLTDRRDDLIISGGVNVYSQEVEHVLSTHVSVGDVAVIGVPHPEMGEEVRAIVQLRDGAIGSPALGEELIELCRERLAHFKCPRTVAFVAEMPRMATGKLSKRALRDRYRNG